VPVQAGIGIHPCRAYVRWAIVWSSLSTPVAPQRSTSIKEIVIVDSACERYADFIAAAEAGEVGLHFCVDGQSAVRLARRFRADVWLVAGELPDMSGFDLLEILMPCVSQGSVDPLLGGAHISLDHDR